MSAKQKVIVWGRSGCSFCTDIQAVLQAKGKDVLRDQLQSRLSVG
ncbi:hypothetical protein [Brevibacillus antibioticus]|nr:hypothetical protein [Brevibacillus antibioticus]